MQSGANDPRNLKALRYLARDRPQAASSPPPVLARNTRCA